jgi:hypothetical protein
VRHGFCSASQFWCPAPAWVGALRPEPNRVDMPQYRQHPTQHRPRPQARRASAGDAPPSPAAGASCGRPRRRRRPHQADSQPRVARVLVHGRLRRLAGHRGRRCRLPRHTGGAAGGRAAGAAPAGHVRRGAAQPPRRAGERRRRAALQPALVWPCCAWRQWQLRHCPVHSLRLRRTTTASCAPPSTGRGRRLGRSAARSGGPRGGDGLGHGRGRARGGTRGGAAGGGAAARCAGAGSKVIGCGGVGAQRRCGGDGAARKRERPRPACVFVAPGCRRAARAA